MAVTKLALFLALALSLSPATARSLPLSTTHDLEARLQGSAVDCWNALFELRSCSNEIVLFFLNGEAYLGQDCCQAIRIITRQCWPAMLSSLGFTAEEGDILRGYCDGSTPAPAATPPASQAPVAASFVTSQELPV